MLMLIVSVLVLVAVGALGWFFVSRMDDASKAGLKDGVNDVFEWAERRGLFPRAPAIMTDYHADYPELKILEDNHDVIRDECRALLEMKDRMTDISALGGSYTTGGIHAIDWKCFMFKSGKFLEPNCELAPKTAALLRRVPGLYTAFFSVLDPHQKVTPHFGYYKGFLRYHLGVEIPNDNQDQKCWLRINANPEDNALQQKSLIDKGEFYYWKNGEGVMFDDTFLHDAANDSDEVRVVMWLDVRRKMPFYLQLFNKFCLFIAHRDDAVTRVRRAATITPA